MKTDNEENQEQETSLRDELDAAIAEVEDNDDGGEEVEQAEPAAEQGEVNNVQETPEIKTQEKEGSKDGNFDGQKQPDTTEADGVKPPASWSPKLREEFTKLAPSVQQQINKREQEITRSLNDGAESRKLGEGFKHVMSSYQPVLAAEGFTDPVQAVQGLMQTAAQLQMGSPQQKATRLAQMIQHYGIDINMLDSALAGTDTPSQETSQLEQMLEQKLAPVQQFMSTIQQGQQHSQQQAQHNAQSEIQQFEQQAEFMGDVRNDMADLMDLASQRGQKLTLKEAYDKACAINPEISAVMAQRQKDEAIRGKQTTIQNKRYAGSSIHGAQTGTGGGGGALDLRGTLEDAWDDSVRN